MDEPEQVVLPPALGATAPARGERLAVFVTHGMGQQVPFATVSELITELRKEPELAAARPVSQTVLLGNQRLQRVSLQLPGREIHFYEGYWAPLTEGVVTLRDVMRFLLRAGLNGLRNSEGVFRRWAFGSSQVYDIPVRSWVYLVVAVVTVTALVSMNAAIALVTVARATLGPRPQWLTYSLFEDLTTTLDIFLLTAVLFGVTLLIAVALRRARLGRRILVVAGFLSALTFVVAVFAAILAGLILPALLLVHGQSASLLTPHPSFWGYLLGEPWPARLSTVSTVVIATFLLLMFLWFIARPWLRIFYRALKEQLGSWWETESNQQQPLTSLLVLSMLVVLVVLVVAAGSAMWRFSRLTAGAPEWPTRLLLTWPALIVTSAVVRYFMVQYVGDVAAYVSSHTIDRFDQVRRQIKDCVYSAAHAVYGAAGAFAYDGVIVVGHSLGSLVSYDVLNRLISEEQLQVAAAGEPSGVVRRTRLFLTFGSPMDKTAFIFAIQTGKTNPTREALVASMQPLIQDYGNRTMPWINIYSPWDIISGALNYYDVRGTPSPPAIQNLPDPDATTFLAAHAEYWHNPLLRRILVRALIT